MKQLNFSKKSYIICAGILAVIIIGLIGYAAIHNSSEGAQFKREYESYNNKKTDSGNSYQKIKINSKNKIKYASLKDAVDIVESGTGIIYFGMPTCPWCRGIVPILLDKADCSCLGEIYYVDMAEERNEYKVTNDLPEETKKASEEYYKLLELLDEYLENYTITDDGVEHVLNEKRIYLPLVVAVKNGQVVDAHTGSVELNAGQSPYDELTETQKSEVGVIFDNMIEKVTADEMTCNEHC